LASRMNVSLTNDELACLFPGRRPIEFSEADLSSPDNFAARLSALRVSRFTPFWLADLDVRLISVTTEPTLHRIAMRVVNVTAPAGRTQSDFVDDNLYGVSLRLKIPSAIHRSMTFQELPASFRYDRNMMAIGINSHVEGRVESGTLRMAVESVP